MIECDLCALPIRDEPITDSDGSDTYCCRGCLEVATTLDEADLDVDRLREARSDPSRTEPDVPDDAASAFLAVDGMHCTTCEAFLALRADEIPGLYAVEANYGTETVRVHYDPDEIDESELPSAVSGHGYVARFRDESGDAAARQRRRSDTLQRLVVGGFFTMLIMPWYLFYLYPGYVGIETGLLDVDTTTAVGLYLPMALIGIMTTVVVFYTGYPVLRGAWVSLRTRRPNMDLLVSIAALSAYAYSTVALATGSTHLYYDVSVAVMMVVTVGRYYEGGIRSRSTERLAEIAGARSTEARLLTDEGRETVATDTLEPEDRIVVPPGERVPVDGTVVDGVAAVDESLITGESLPVTRRRGDDVVGGAVVTDDALVVEVGPHAESTADRIATALWEIQSATPGVQRFVDRLATVFVPTVLLLGLAVTAWGLATGATVAAALLAGLTVLVVSCPCAMGLATPLALAGGLRDALDRGIVVTDETLFEVAPDADTVVFDKTGTLTAGEMRVTDVHGAEETLRIAAAVERRSEHPVAEAVLDAADAVLTGDGPSTDPVADGGSVVVEPDRDADPTAIPHETYPELSAFERHPGEGVSGVVDGSRAAVGTPSLIEREIGPIGEELRDRIRAAEERGGLPVVVGWDDAARGVIVVEDRERESWDAIAESVAAFEVCVLTGDDGPSAEQFREHPAVDRVFAGVPPDGKSETIRRLSAAGTTVMIGDGTNDAPALAAADLGIAMGDGTARATDAADVVVLDDDLTAIESIFELANGTRRRIRENVCWALLYNAVAIPLAVAGLINPLFAALAMAASSIIVVTNSTRPVV